MRQEYSARRKLARLTAESGCSRWPTATTMDTMDAARKGIVGNHNLSLPVAAQGWATPTSRDHKDGADPSEKVDTNSLLGRQAPRATGPAFRQDSGPRRLNPAFVEWLMGWPRGWTDFAPVATEWSHWWRLMRSELSRLPWLDA